ncbi:hypothetical protein [Streptomyces sp. 5-10]|uniref:hypothetical protein n=1 Tax=Streptomyces sp. 5-10 TaxID=878925 RepID=UPI00168B6FC1|nr:hypothetical protein [Streptomyces sp. 5-10]MBD3004675.1 hypothetical protein [Streptomyces sp. 5-10]
MTSYGTWCSRVDEFGTSPDGDVAAYVGSADPEWRDRIQANGMYAQMCAAYRDAIEARLPASVSLRGNEFIGPAHPEPGEFDGYPLNEFGSLDIGACIKGERDEEKIDVAAIVDHFDPDDN